MHHLKSAFIQLALDCQALQFGEFTLKSGRVSPYFFNAGMFYHASALQRLGEFYAHTLIHHQVQFDHLFGPAYKGIPLATSTAVALAHLGYNITVTFNRKETKSHGEGGELIGSPLQGKTVVIDDVITAGTAFRQAQTLIKDNGGQLIAAIIALDRCEKGQGMQSALAEINKQQIATYSIIDLFDLIDFLKVNQQTKQVKQMETYLEHYGLEPNA